MAVKTYFISDLQFICSQNPITVGDGKCKIKAPYDGEILGNASGAAVTGYIMEAGSGVAGLTTIQLRNETQTRDYLDTQPSFREADQDANGRAILSAGTLRSRPTFKQNDVICLDIDAIPAGSDSAHATVWATCGFWREV